MGLAPGLRRDRVNTSKGNVEAVPGSCWECIEKMSLRRRGIVVTVLALTAAIVISLVVSQTILMRRFDELEKRETRQNVDRAVSALYSDFSKVSIAWGGPTDCQQGDL